MDELGELQGSLESNPIPEKIKNIRAAINIIKPAINDFNDSNKDIEIDTNNIEDIEFDKDRKILVNSDMTKIEDEFSIIERKQEKSENISIDQLKSIASPLKQLYDRFKRANKKVLILKASEKPANEIKQAPLINANENSNIPACDDKSEKQPDEVIHEIANLNPSACIKLAKQLHEMNEFMKVYDSDGIKKAGQEILSILLDNHLKPLIKMIDKTHPLYQPIIDISEMGCQKFDELYNTIKQNSFELENYAKIHTSQQSSNYLFSPNSFSNYLVDQANMEIHSSDQSQLKLGIILGKCIEHQARMQIVIGNQQSKQERIILGNNASKLARTINVLQGVYLEDEDDALKIAMNDHEAEELSRLNFRLKQIKDQDEKLDKFQKNLGNDIEINNINLFFITDCLFNISNIDDYLEPADILIEKFDKLEEMLSDFNEKYTGKPSDDSMHDCITHIRNEIAEIRVYYSQHPYIWKNKKINVAFSLLKEKENELFPRERDCQVNEIQNHGLYANKLYSENNPAIKFMSEIFLYYKNSISTLNNFYELDIELNILNLLRSRIHESALRFEQLKIKLEDDLACILIDQFFSFNDFFDIKNINKYLNDFDNKMNEAENLADIKCHHYTKLNKMLSNFDKDYPDNSFNDSMHKSIHSILDKIAEIKKYYSAHSDFWNAAKIKNPIPAEKENELICRALANQLREMNKFMQEHDSNEILTNETEKSRFFNEHLRPFIKIIGDNHPLHKSIQGLLNNEKADIYNTLKNDALELESYARLHTADKPPDIIFCNSFANHLVAQADMEIKIFAPSETRLDEIWKKCNEHYARMQIVIGSQSNPGPDEAKSLYDNITELGNTITALKSAPRGSQEIATYANGKSKYIKLDKSTLSENICIIKDELSKCKPANHDKSDEAPHEVMVCTRDIISDKDPAMKSHKRNIDRPVNNNEFRIDPHLFVGPDRISIGSGVGNANGKCIGLLSFSAKKIKDLSNRDCLIVAAIFLRKYYASLNWAEKLSRFTPPKNCPQNIARAMLAYWKLSGEFSEYPKPDFSSISVKFKTAAEQMQYENEMEGYSRESAVKAEISKSTDYLLSAKEKIEHEVNEKLQITTLVNNHSAFWAASRCREEESALNPSVRQAQLAY